MQAKIEFMFLVGCFLFQYIASKLGMNYCEIVGEDCPWDKKQSTGFWGALEPALQGI